MKPIITGISNEELEAMHNAQYEEWFAHEEVDRPVYTGASSWPFPITNGVRSAESQSLLDNKQKPSTIKPSLDNEQDALL